VTLPQMSDRENMTPIGTMARRYTLPVMGTFLRESRTVVKRARPWVIRVAKPRCHVVRTMAVERTLVIHLSQSAFQRRHRVRYLNSIVWRMYLLNRMTEDDNEIHALSGRQYYPRAFAYLMRRTRRILLGGGQMLVQAQASLQPGCG
jgi:hypothetical protein